MRQITDYNDIYALFPASCSAIFMFCKFYNRLTGKRVRQPVSGIAMQDFEKGVHAGSQPGAQRAWKDLTESNQRPWEVLPHGNSS